MARERHEERFDFERSLSLSPNPKKRKTSRTIGDLFHVLFSPTSEAEPEKESPGAGRQSFMPDVLPLLGNTTDQALDSSSSSTAQPHSQHREHSPSAPAVSEASAPAESAVRDPEEVYCWNQMQQLTGDTLVGLVAEEPDSQDTLRVRSHEYALDVEAITNNKSRRQEAEARLAERERQELLEQAASADAERFEIEMVEFQDELSTQTNLCRQDGAPIEFAIIGALMLTSGQAKRTLITFAAV